LSQAKCLLRAHASTSGSIFLSVTRKPWSRDLLRAVVTAWSPCGDTEAAVRPALTRSPPGTPDVNQHAFPFGDYRVVAQSDITAPALISGINKRGSYRVT
jgi:hypothetical protein